jgi:hypothetical protein
MSDMYSKRITNEYCCHITDFNKVHRSNLLELRARYIKAWMPHPTNIEPKLI